ncbi:MAG: hypothetical protein ABJH82_09620 [Polaribacter sp.]|uniref:hypothetical protein n=1 Tax=Polaribacter sp. TaxID=1920175 RepID=UPI003265225C
MNNKIFKEAINSKLVVNMTFNSVKKGVLTRRCVPFDYGPSRRFRDKSQRYHFLVLDGPEGRHNLSILPIQIVKIELTDVHFEPSKFIKWKPKWFIKRNWGVYS